MNTFCTIITANYYPKALTLFKSIREFNKVIELQILVIDHNIEPEKYPVPPGIRLIPLADLRDYPLVNDLYRKYAHVELDYFRWSMKSVFISYLLEKGFDKVLYLDCDMYFFNDYDFLFSELDSASVLLVPHWENSDPVKDKDSFILLFTTGVFSAGFIGVNKNGLPAMKWWANACHFMMGAHINIGIFDDQRYLDIFPVKFKATRIIRHPGCIVGPWNIEESRRVAVNGTVLINGEFPVIFIHFDGMFIQGILRGHEDLLLPYLEIYTKAFEESGAKLSDYIKEINTHTDVGWMTRGKWKLSVRTRIKRMLYKLSQKL